VRDFNYNLELNVGLTAFISDNNKEEKPTQRSGSLYNSLKK
jgi:hypothetical protein